jgi:hypothetical protein
VAEAYWCALYIEIVAFLSHNSDPDTLLTAHGPYDATTKEKHRAEGQAFYDAKREKRRQQARRFRFFAPSLVYRESFWLYGTYAEICYLSHAEEEGEETPIGGGCCITRP